LVAWLCTDATADVNGQTLRIMQGRVAIFQEPFEKISIIKEEGDQLFTLDDLDRQMSVLFAGVSNPAPASPTE